MSKADIIKLELIRMQLIKKLLVTNELPLLEKIENLLYPNQSKETTIPLDHKIIEDLGYWLNGDPVTEKSLLKRLEKAEKEGIEGKLMSHEEFQKEAENW